MKYRVWFNHWFSTAFNLIENIKKDDINNYFYFIGTGKRRMAYKEVCEEYYIEPDLTGKEYIQFCINFCKEHNINVFVPRKERLNISKHLNLFHEIGVKVLVDSNYSLLSDLESKTKTGLLFQNDKNLSSLVKIPEMLIATNISEFENNYRYLKEKYPNDRICFKYEIDEGALSFRVIDDRQDNISSLSNYQGSKISYDKAIEILSSEKSFSPIIQMIYLNGEEISVDSLLTQQGFIGCARTKAGIRMTKITDMDDSFQMITISRMFAEKTKIKNPYNLQFRKHNEELYLLEINTRLAGGTYRDYLIGYNFPYIALCDLLDIPFETPMKYGTALIETNEYSKIINVEQ